MTSAAADGRRVLATGSSRPSVECGKTRFLGSKSVLI